MRPLSVVGWLPYRPVSPNINSPSPSLSSPMAAPSSAVGTRVSTDTVRSAVNALIKWRSSKSKTQKPQLLEQDDFIYLVLTLKKIPPKGRTNAHKIPLPHPLHGGDLSELCLIIDDRPKPSKLTSDAAKKKIKADDIPVAKVLKFSKLKSDYRPFEAKRKLCDSFDLFFADKRVVPLLPKLLGKQFFKKKKIPVPVDLTHKNWKEQIERACSSALLYLTTGTCSVMKVGKASMESGEIVENVVAAIDGAAEFVPKRWSGVRSCHLKFSESLALPIYQTLPDLRLKIEGTKHSEEGIQEEESKKDEKLDGGKGVSRKKGKGKGRIHEVRYMDGDELESEADEEGIEEEENKDNREVGSFEFGVRKRKEGDSIDNLVPSSLNGRKRSNKSAAMGEKSEESRGKKGKRKEGDSIDNLVPSSLNGGKRSKKSAAVGEQNEESAGKKVKRKEGDSIDNLVPGNLNGGKRSEKSAAMGEKSEDSGGKKVKSKSGVGKLKDGANKLVVVRDKKTKKNRSAG